ncbi:MAG: sulfotransferase [Proteobacteria bacterium]|nr:sulfotransferase [Pseudomonadota bacterium]
MHDTLRDGLNALTTGRIKVASECCQRVLGAKPDLPEGHFLVGLIALEMRQTRTAISAFGSVTKLEPKHGAAWAQLAKLFFRSGHLIRADEALARAVTNEKGDPIVHDLLGMVYSMLGDQREAATWFDKAATAMPGNPKFLVNHAQNEMYLGHLESAENGLRKALDIQPDGAQAHWVLAGLRKATNFEHVETLRPLAADSKTPLRAQAFLNYALGKELEDLQAWDEAFDAFARGAAARRKDIDVDEQAEIDMFDTLRNSYDADWLAGKTGFDSSAPIFIVGQPRTGTTLIERIITSHSQVHSAGELRQFGSSIRRLTRYKGRSRYSAELVTQAKDLDGIQLGRAYMESSQKMQGSTPRFVDKLPPNYIYLPLILMALPNAKIIHVRRNAMDACFASFKQLFADAYLHSYDQAEMARHHARYYHLMQHYRDQFDGRFFEISYEDTARDVEPNARAMIDFLELPWEEACLEFHKQTTAVTTASTVQVREPAHTRSIGRWRRYEKQLEPMRNALEEHGVVIGES